MYQINDYLKYGKDVCRVKEIEEKKFNDQDYYLLVPMKDETLKIEIPVTSDKVQDLISKEELESLLNKITDIEPIEMEEKFMESEYKRLMSTGEYEDIIKVIKTTYLRNKARKENNKKLAEKDINYFQLAEDYLYNEFSVVLGKSYDDTKNYVITKIDEILAN
ncbi:MAG: CarD family transcriptional regulator [Bacilli bacterium]|nr:CarD family transcriptional regulator [Bacilli bacterium]